jgi:hypothetical protein
MGQLLTTVDTPQFTIPLKAVFFVGDCLIKRDVSRLRRLAPNGILPKKSPDMDDDKATHCKQ